MTQDQNPHRLRASLHFLLHPALSGTEKRQLAGQIRSPQDGLCAQPPLQLTGQTDRWTEWLQPLGRIQAAEDLIRQWLDDAPASGIPRRWVSYWDEDYPAILRNSPRPPWLLLLEGQLPPATAPVLAIVGSRSATRAGLRRAREFAAEMARHGWVIASGMARGIDGAAHAGALDAGGHTLAVLGCGIDVVYPPEHAHLRAAIVQAGGAVISEYPPGTPPHERFFPARNRIIAACSNGVLVVEAAVRSGSLITAHMANEMGRAVMAIPGSIDSPQSRGCHQMIRAGARLVESVEDIFDELQGIKGQASLPGLPKPQAVKPENHNGMSKAMRGLLALFKGQALQFDEISTTCGLPTDQLSGLLLQLELAGLVESRPGQWWAPT